jgi:peptidoglycan/LPS O-acetylase OafA/YrhL
VKTRYRSEIDGLRALAVIAVIINHFNRELLPSGFLGVDIFFVISGYVITSSLADREYESIGDFLLGFYSRRIKRLMPTLITCITITCLVGFLFIPPTSGDFEITWKTGAYALFGLSNFYLFRLSTDYFAATTELNLFTQTWSLGVEEQFYLVFPIILWITGFITGRPRGKSNLFFLMIVLSVLSLCT